MDTDFFLDFIICKFQSTFWRIIFVPLCGLFNQGHLSMCGVSTVIIFCQNNELIQFNDGSFFFYLVKSFEIHRSLEKRDKIH